jgi:hypothetical protein
MTGGQILAKLKPGTGSDGDKAKSPPSKARRHPRFGGREVGFPPPAPFGVRRGLVGRDNPRAFQFSEFAAGGQGPHPQLRLPQEGEPLTVLRGPDRR